MKLGRVAIDGTKVKANASKHKAMSYGRMEEAERRLEEEVKRLLEEAERVDAEEDAQFGKGKRGDELPGELARRESRLEKIREAKAALEREAKAQRNFTDPESRIMRDGATKEFTQAYNAQLAVDAQAQIIVATALTQAAADNGLLASTLRLVEQNLGRLPTEALADAGYFSEGAGRSVRRRRTADTTSAVTDPGLAAVELYVPPNKREKSVDGEVQGTGAPQGPAAQTMREKLASASGKAVYKLRKAIVEPVIGQIKEVRGFRRFSFRGLQRVAAEWDFVCLTHNLLKLFRHKLAIAPAR